MNVKAVVDKYGGDFAISCDSEKFQAVVMMYTLWSFREKIVTWCNPGLKSGRNCR